MATSHVWHLWSPSFTFPQNSIPLLFWEGVHAFNNENSLHCSQKLSNVPWFIWDRLQQNNLLISERSAMMENLEPVTTPWPASLLFIYFDSDIITEVGSPSDTSWTVCWWQTHVTQCVLAPISACAAKNETKPTLFVISWLAWSLIHFFLPDPVSKFRCLLF